MFELISIVEDDFDSSTISSVALTEWLRTSGLAEKDHRNVLRDIDEMMAAKAEIDALISERISFEGTYKTANNQERRCWYLTIDDAIVLCSRYSYKIGFVLVEEIGRLRKRIRELEEENLRIMLEHTARLEFDNSMMARDLELLTFRELKWKELNATQVAQFIRANMYEIDSSESTFSPSVIDLNDILFKMGLIGYRTQFNQKRPNPASIQQKFYDEYPGVPLAQKFGQAMTFCASEAAFTQLLIDLKSYGIKNNIGIKK